jgi:glycosyltransferase involved in cell wall biosynthesis
MVSIILCTYNRATLIARAIQSVLEQSYSNWELIIVDDGSHDDTHDIIAPFVLMDQRICYYYQTNRGLATARNIGIELAGGEFITFLDSDDEYAPQHILTRVSFMQSHPGTDMLHGGVLLIGPKEKQYVTDLTDPTRTIHLLECHTGGTFFFRKHVARAIQGFRTIPFGEDFDFFLRAKQHFVIGKLECPTYLYHLEGDDRLCNVFTPQL